MSTANQQRQDLIKWTQITVFLTNGSEVVICCDAESAEGYVAQLCDQRHQNVRIKGRRATPLIVAAELIVDSAAVIGVDLQSVDGIAFESNMQTLMMPLTSPTWRDRCEVVYHGEMEYWARITDDNGIYHWLNPITLTWVDEPDQRELAMFVSEHAARNAIRKASKPPGVM